MTLMVLQPGEDIGLELHTQTDQFIRVEAGEGVVYMGDTEENLDFEQPIKEDFAVFIPANKWHNLKNTGDEPLKLYSIYAPVEHEHGTIHKTREEGLQHDHDH
jgi:mannose-6-phosphate isomerase-like protein (cupin superfamily)